MRTLLDLLSDELARRSGILLSIGEVRELGAHVEANSCRDVLLGDLDGVVDRASDIYADLARALRVAIGNLPDDEPPIIRRMRMTRALSEAGVDPLPALEAFARLAIEQPGRMIGEADCEEVMRRTGAPRLAVNAAFLMLADHFDREASLSQVPKNREWDGAVPLGQLFDAELAPSDPDAYLDQRFLDYLAAREEKLDQYSLA
jgi:restriction system protein